MKPLSSRTIAVGLTLAVLAGCATKKGETPANAAATTAKASPSPSPAAEATPTPSPSPSPTPKPKREKKPPTVKVPLWMQALNGFGIFNKLFPPKPKPPKAEAAQLIGTIKMVNKDDRFVLIDALVYQGASPGEALICIMDQKQTASLIMSNLRNPPFLIADITGGDPSPGDRVYKP